MKRAFALTAATLVAALGITGTAAAAQTNVFLDGFSSHYFTGGGDKAPNATDIYGHLKSGKQKCVTGRRVSVLLVQSGPDLKAGQDTSDSNGGWSLMIPFDDYVEGTYYAKAPKRVLHDGTVCDAGRSANVSDD